MTRPVKPARGARSGAAEIHERFNESKGADPIAAFVEMAEYAYGLEARLRGAVDWKRVAGKIVKAINFEGSEQRYPEDSHVQMSNNIGVANFLYNDALTRERKTNKAREGGGKKK